MLFALIVFILFLGVLFIYLEIFFLPGTTLFALAGIVITVAAFILAYKLLDSKYVYILGGLSLVFMLLLFLFGKKWVSKSNLTLTKEIKGGVSQKAYTDIEIGEEGKTVTDIRPNGKAIFKNQKIEVFSRGEFIDSHSLVKVVDINGKKIIVEPIKL